MVFRNVVREILDESARAYREARNQADEAYYASVEQARRVRAEALAQADEALIEALKQAEEAFASEQPSLLNETERNILRMMAQGRNNLNIAGSLDIPVKRVGKYVSDILVRLDAKNRAHAVTIAVRKGIIVR